MWAHARSQRSSSTLTDPRWYNGPPYAVVEDVFDEDSIEGCELAPVERVYDDSGRSRIVPRPRENPVPKDET